MEASLACCDFHGSPGLGGWMARPRKGNGGRSLPLIFHSSLVGFIGILMVYERIHYFITVWDLIPPQKKNYTLLLNKLLRYGFRGDEQQPRNPTPPQIPDNFVENTINTMAHLFWKGKTPSKSPSLGSMTVSGVVTTHQGTSISPLKVAGKMIFFLHRLEMFLPTGVSFFFDKISSGISQCWGTAYHFGSLGS